MSSTATAHPAGSGAPSAVVRPLRCHDIAGVVDLRRRLWPDEVTTVESYSWSLAHGDPAEQVRRWVASEAGRVVGFAAAGRAVWTTEGVGFEFFGVAPERRLRGIGRRLCAAADRHLAPLRPTRILSACEQGDLASAGFLARRCFVHSRDDQAWSVDPRRVPVDGLAERLAAAEAEGLRLVPMRALLDRPGDLYELHLALQADLPSDTPVAEAYDAWLTHEFGTPLFAPDASFCILDGEDASAAAPVALTWINLDRAGGRAQHGMTGTLPRFRHRGLARLVKLASISWLAGHGVTALYTDNDTTNCDMLALNEHLGFRPLTVYEMWARPG